VNREGFDQTERAIPIAHESRPHAVSIGLHGNYAMARPYKSDALRWLDKAPVATKFEVPATRRAWEKKRLEVRRQLWQLLGRLPSRPKIPRVEILSRADRGDYVLEKFRFDNVAGATVPGYLLLPWPVERIRKSPAILYCQWHGGE